MFETAMSELVSVNVVTCTPHVAAMSEIESLGVVPETISCLSSAARRLSREFRLRECQE